MLKNDFLGRISELINCNLGDISASAAKFLLGSSIQHASQNAGYRTMTHR